MTSLRLLQEKQKKDAAANAGKGVKQSAGELRLQKGETRTLCNVHGACLSLDKLQLTMKHVMTASFCYCMSIVACRHL